MPWSRAKASSSMAADSISNGPRSRDAPTKVLEVVTVTTVASPVILLETVPSGVELEAAGAPAPALALVLALALEIGIAAAAPALEEEVGVAHHHPVAPAPEAARKGKGTSPAIHLVTRNRAKNLAKNPAKNPNLAKNPAPALNLCYVFDEGHLFPILCPHLLMEGKAQG